MTPDVLKNFSIRANSCTNIARHSSGVFGAASSTPSPASFFCTSDKRATALTSRFNLAMRRQISFSIRAGVHAGEFDLRENDASGLTVHIASRVANLAGAGEVFASSTVKDLLAGSGIDFEPRGEHVLKGVPDTWRLFAATG